MVPRLHFFLYRNKQISNFPLGTWQNSDGSTPSSPTNITRLVRALLPATPASHRSPPIPQIVYYQAGIGSTTGSKLISGATGNSLPEHLREAYGFLAHNYSPGDSIHLFGFSRGAYTARCIAGLITRLGVLTKRGMDNFYSIYERFQLDGLSDDSFLKPYHNLPSSSDELKLVNYPVPITTIGCFDTVGALGIPTLPIPGLRDLVSGVNTKRYQFLDTTLSPGILNAFHALALDERRRPFSPTLWRKREGLHDAVNLKQCWFPGVHTNVGGGYTDQEIADITLAWMIQQCSPFLAFNRSYLRRIVENRGDGKGEWAAGKVEESFRGFHVLGGSKIRTPGGYGEGTEETIHVSVRLRKKVVGGWRCRAMEGWGWDEGERCWRMGERVLREEELGDWEVELAGREVVETVMVKAGTGLKDRGVKVKEVRKGSGGSRSGSGSEEVLV